MTSLYAIDGGRWCIRSSGAAALVKGEFKDLPNLADFLEQCFAALERHGWPQFDQLIGARLLSDKVVVDILRELRRSLTERFGRRVATGGGWVRILEDVDKRRARAVLALFPRFSLTDYVMQTKDPMFADLREYFAAADSEFLRFLLLQQGEVNERRTRLHLAFIHHLAIMVCSPRHPGVVADREHRVGNLVDILLHDEDVVDDDPAAPEVHATATVAERLPPPPPAFSPPPYLRLVGEDE